jgi:hypothetical protein
MEEGLFRIRSKTLVPAIYRIYLNPADYEPFRDVVPFIAGEIRAALDERLAQWNGSQRKFALGLLKRATKTEAPREAAYVRATDAWTVEVYPDLDGKLALGEIEVYSELGSPQKTEYGAGSLTRRIVPNPPPEPPAENSDSSPTVATVRSPGASAEEEKEESRKAPEEDRTKGRAFAYLRFRDEGGEHMFEVTKNQVVIGRGGRSFWVDVKLETLPDISREHCRIRREPETGRFTIEDVSQFGTAVNGKPVGKNASAELPRRATISLAGVLDMQWETA